MCNKILANPEKQVVDRITTLVKLLLGSTTSRALRNVDFVCQINREKQIPKLNNLKDRLVDIETRINQIF